MHDAKENKNYDALMADINESKSEFHAENQYLENELASEGLWGLEDAQNELTEMMASESKPPFNNIYGGC